MVLQHKVPSTFLSLFRRCAAKGRSQKTLPTTEEYENLLGYDFFLFTLVIALEQQYGLIL